MEILGSFRRPDLARHQKQVTIDQRFLRLELEVEVK